MGKLKAVVISSVAAHPSQHQYRVRCQRVECEAVKKRERSLRARLDEVSANMDSVLSRKVSALVLERTAP
eukprot:392636-Pleurochrysis_carterae.AAC.1